MSRVGMIRDHLLSYCSSGLFEELGNLSGEQLDNKIEQELLAEMRRLAAHQVLPGQVSLWSGGRGAALGW